MENRIQNPNKLECHSGTSYKEIIEFINNNKGKKILFHYEIPGYSSWGNDEIDEIILDEAGIKKINDYLGTEIEYRNQNSSYVHNITII